MTVGQRIQEHRKKNGLSQEELGQRLLVSRQTVSLWEKDQTLPTVDNLLLLKEIFGISVDELLGVEKVAEEEATEALEVHTFTYEKEPLRAYFKRQCGVAALCLVFLLAATVFICAEEIAFWPGILCGILLCVAWLLVRRILQLKKTWHRMIKDYPETTVTASLYEEKLVLRSVCRGALLWEKHMTFDKIEKVTKAAAYYHLFYGGKIYLIPFTVFQKGGHDPETRLEALLKSLMERGKKELTAGRWRWISFGLCFLSIISLSLGLMLSEGIGILSGKAGIYFWAFYAVLPIPLASVAVGVYLLRQRKMAWKNIVIGVISAFLLVIFGSFPFLISSSLEEGAENIFETQEIRLGMDFPNIVAWEQTVLFASKGNWQSDSISKAIYSEEDSRRFAWELSRDPRWLTELPAEWKDLANEDWSGDYVLMYNVTRSELNRIPTAEGTYEVNVLSYDCVENSLTVYAYYVKCTSEES